MLKILVIIQTQNEFTDVSLWTHFFRYLYRNKNKLSATVNDKLIHVQVGDEEIKATPTHPFWVIGLGWVNAGDLQVGDKILLSSGQTEAIDEITEELLKEPIKVYNFEVEDWHTYFVSEKNILVHNTCSKPVGNKGGKKTVEVNGKRVTMDNNTFDPNLVDKQGRTNIQRMDQGLAPIGTDGKSVNIHHIDQTNNGPVMEITATKHQQNYSKLHANTGQTPSQINRKAFNNWRNEYWKWRGNNPE